MKNDGGGRGDVGSSDKVRKVDLQKKVRRGLANPGLLTEPL